MKEFEFVAEIIPNRLYFAVCDRQKCPEMEGQQLMLYFNFYVRKIEKSFGPPNIGVVHEYITEVKTMLKKYNKRVIIHIGFTDEKDVTTNSAFLVGAFSILELKKDPSYVSKLIHNRDIIMSVYYGNLNKLIYNFFFVTLQTVQRYDGTLWPARCAYVVLLSGAEDRHKSEPIFEPGRL